MKAVVVEDLTARGVDVLLHAHIFNDVPEEIQTKDGRTTYKIAPVRRRYMSYTSTTKEEHTAPLPYYSTDYKALKIICDHESVNWSVHYSTITKQYLACVSNTSYAYKTMVGALSRAFLIRTLTNKGITVNYTLLGKDYTHGKR